MSWEELDDIPSDIEDEAQVIPDKDKQILSAVFNTPEGVQALSIIRRWVSKSNMPNPEWCADGAMMAQLMFLAEGEKNLYRRIRACVAKPVLVESTPAAKPKSKPKTKRGKK